MTKVDRHRDILVDSEFSPVLSKPPVCYLLVAEDGLAIQALESIRRGSNGIVAIVASSYAKKRLDQHTKRLLSVA
jgi:hypothetical protein